MTTFAERIKSARKSLNLNQKDFAILTGIGPTATATICNYETGRNIPGGDFLQKVAAAGFDGHWLLTGEGKMHSAPRIFKTAIYKEQEILLRLLGLNGDINQIIALIAGKAIEGGVE